MKSILNERYEDLLSGPMEQFEDASVRALRACAWESARERE